MSYDIEALRYHKEPRPGKIEVVPSKPCLTQSDLSLAYTPGVAVPCLEIRQDPDSSFDYTTRGNLVGVITNGTAVLGLGNIGPMAAKPHYRISRVPAHRQKPGMRANGHRRASHGSATGRRAAKKLGCVPA